MAMENERQTRKWMMGYDKKREENINVRLFEVDSGI